MCICKYQIKAQSFNSLIELTYLRPLIEVVLVVESLFPSLCAPQQCSSKAKRLKRLACRSSGGPTSDVRMALNAIYQFKIAHALEFFF